MREIEFRQQMLDHATLYIYFYGNTYIVAPSASITLVKGAFFFSGVPYFLDHVGAVSGSAITWT